MPQEPQQLGDIFAQKKVIKKAPTYEWQDFALRIIEELKIPAFKRSAVFKICKQYPKQDILNALNDTKELCTSGQSWKYFFKIINSRKQGAVAQIPDLAKK